VDARERKEGEGKKRDRKDVETMEIGERERLRAPGNTRH